MFKTLRSRSVIFAAALLVLCGSAMADAVSVSSLVSGSAGDWTINFSVTNNINSYQAIYFFGVQLDNSSITGTPSPFHTDNYTWNNAINGGSNTNYNDLWQVDSLAPGRIAFGSTLSGFKIHLNTTDAPGSIRFFAWSASDAPLINGFYDSATFYNGNDAFLKGPNPGFEGTTTPTNPVPEPGSFVLLGSGLVGMAGAVRRKLMA